MKPGNAHEKRPNQPVVMNTSSPSPGMLSAAFDEVHKKTPAVVKHTAAKFGKKRAEKQRVAIALSKARRGAV
jgi:hypothetical protein